MQGRLMSCARRELCLWLDIVATNKPKLYLDCRLWLEHYADTHAEQSPISLISYLPRGRKQFYHLIYERDRRVARQTGKFVGFLGSMAMRVFLDRGP